MRFAEHLAIAYVCRAAHAPRRSMIGVHIFYIPNFALVRVVTDSAQRAV
jgi:hypothetical protein